VCQKKYSPPSSPLPCRRQIFGKGSSTSGSLHLSFSSVKPKLGFVHLFFGGAGPKLGSLAAWVMGMQKHWGRTRSWSSSQPLLCATSSTLSYSLVSFLLIMWLALEANLSSVPPPRPCLILLYLHFQLCSELWHKLISVFHCTLYYFFVLVKREIYLLVLNTILFATLLCERVCSMCVSLQWYLERETRGNNWIFCDKCENTVR